MNHLQQIEQYIIDGKDEHFIMNCLQAVGIKFLEAVKSNLPYKDAIMPIRPKHYIVTQYAMDYYVIEQCTLCGNSGIIDTRGVRTAAGVHVGRLNWCICPNGQAYRNLCGGLPTEELLRNRRPNEAMGK